MFERIAAIILTVLIVISCGIILGCKAQDGTQNSDDNYSIYERRIYVDAKTGVNYITGPYGSITPRYNADGSLYVTEVGED